MSKLNILEFPDPRLTTVAKEVVSFDDDLKKLVADMTETMYAARGIGLAATQVNVHKRLLVLDISEKQARGIGLAATQVNVHKRLLVLDISEKQDQPRVYVNPQIIDSSGEQIYEEGCLSVPGIYAEVKRADKITVRAQNPDGSVFEEHLEGLHAICVQHEMDHLIGRLFVDYLSPLKRNMVRKKLEKQRKIAAHEAEEHLVI